MEKKRNNPAPLNLPPSVVEVAEKLKGCVRDSMEDELLRGIQVSAEQCTELKNATVNQASNILLGLISGKGELQQAGFTVWSVV
ncbi:hypothetical protein DPMN_106013 [Dreissena polymorpha]|uniref:Uncharacterized protein n=1 Tax=Dreissena polymorpha TaxID=45954 RepID=A0A9D4K4B2_DREPO|nr:hypothetical protein DPMN_106013 [Dreissena polymorpha]